MIGFTAPSGGKKIINVGYVNGNNITFNIAALVPNKYSKLTTADFYHQCYCNFTFTGNGGSMTFSGASPTLSYSPSTGVLTVSNCHIMCGTSSDHTWAFVYGYIYLVL